jgi:hypothetical protein
MKKRKREKTVSEVRASLLKKREALGDPWPSLAAEALVVHAARDWYAVRQDYIFGNDISNRTRGKLGVMTDKLAEAVQALIDLDPKPTKMVSKKKARTRRPECRCAGPHYHPDKPCPAHPKGKR